MKTTLMAIAFALFTTVTFAQTTSSSPIQNISTDSSVIYRLFSTKNIYNFIKLNTRNGKMTQVQWGTKSKHRFETVLSETPLVSEEEEKNGRFFLYPTTNSYNFILLDQINGKTWQVQWSIERDERMVIRIY